MSVPLLEARPDAIGSYAAALRDLASRLLLLSDPVVGTGSQEWTGLAADRYAAVADSLGRRAAACAASVRAIADRVDDHALAISRLQRRRAELVAAGRGLHHPDVAAWRAAVAAEERGVQQALRGSSPRIRHAANVAALEHDLARLGPLARRGDLTGVERRWWTTATRVRAALHRITTTVDPVTGRPVPATLWLYDPTAFDGDGRVAVVVGDLETADDVALVVPGLGTDAASTAFQVERTLGLHLAARHVDPRAGNATVAWVGYDAPNGLPPLGDGAGVLSGEMAAAGGALLSGDVAALRDHGARDAHLTVIGYSYGSTVAGLAAAGPGLAADDLVLVGSPGVGAGNDAAVDTGLDPGRVWVLRNSHDPVAALGSNGWLPGDLVGLGDDPAGDDWGGVRLQAESVTRGPHDVWAAHTAYFDPDSEALRNLAHVVTGDVDGVRAAAPVRDPWYAPPRDPELYRQPTAPDTGPRP